ncbi:MAG TPA: bifunctional homocysteine S-methyltransferase/methylenetetrahydrofolate reductase [Planctomycetota bacterium]|nr:bifunctional homocysteine S-methyltransferase/methylenetetrahydrofolate reductase [Planctomycetota bacterium]
MADLLKALAERVVVGDGAMGTQIYAKGVTIGRCFDELNLTHPHLVRVIHREYAEAGAEFLETNTFTANRLRLVKFGLEKKVREINVAGAALARDVAGADRFVGGSIGPLTGVKHEEIEPGPEEKFEIFAEQAAALAEGGADALILETFTDLEELKIALRAARARTKLPAICQMAFVENFRTPLGVTADRAVEELEREGADVIGANCTVPHRTTGVIERMGSRTRIPLSAFPNAGLPEYVDGRYLYLTTPDYLADQARKMVNAGASLVGGCCGTGPDHIRAVAAKVAGLRPAPRRLRVPEPEPLAKEPATPAGVVIEGRRKGRPFADRLGKEPLVVVELDPPRGLEFERVLRGARKLKKAGVDAITVGDNPLAVMRMGNIGMAHLMEREGIQTIVHMSCRDKNLIALQSTLLEACALGITSILAITGDPARVGDQPQASSVYDLNSFELIRLIKNLNEGTSYAGSPIGGRSRFLIGCAFNPNVRDIDAQVRRLKKKIAAGAQFALSQPLYDLEKIPLVYERVRAGVGEFPVFFGILAMVSASNAEFLAHEVPGISIPDAVVERMKRAPESDQREEGMRIARELIDRAAEFAPGYYIIPSFGNIRPTVELVKHIRKISAHLK